MNCVDLKVYLDKALLDPWENQAKQVLLVFLDHLEHQEREGSWDYLVTKALRVLRVQEVNQALKVPKEIKELGFQGLLEFQDH
jgi:hypothetical protein